MMFFAELLQLLLSFVLGAGTTYVLARRTAWPAGRRVVRDAMLPLEVRIRELEHQLTQLRATVEKLEAARMGWAH